MRDETDSQQPFVQFVQFVAKNILRDLRVLRGFGSFVDQMLTQRRRAAMAMWLVGIAWKYQPVFR